MCFFITSLNTLKNNKYKPSRHEYTKKNYLKNRLLCDLDPKRHK